jgi:DNA-binding CsgD family transcriptional regulator
MGNGRSAIPIPGITDLVSIAPSLTERQTKIVEMIAAGYTDKQLAGRLGMSPGTLRTHLDRLFRRFGVHTRAALVAGWLRSL